MVIYFQNQMIGADMFILRKNNLFKKLIILLIIFVGFGFSYNALAGKSDNSIVFGQSTAVTDLGPAYGAFLMYPGGYEASFAIYDRLVTFDENLNIKPQLATSWSVSEDQKVITFKLREGVKFHDGSDFNAEAVKFNVERMMDEKINTTNRPLWDPIAGSDVIDEYTVTINTKEPYAILLNTLAHGSGAIVSPAAIKMSGQDSMTLQPVGAGPFMLESFKPGQELVLKAFDDYWAGKPKTDKLIFKYIPEATTRVSALKTGSVDIIDQVPTQMVQSLERSADIKVISKAGLRPMGFSMITVREPYDDIKVRRALNYAVPVEAICEKVFLGYAKPSDSPLAFDTIGHTSVGGFSYNPEMAKSLLKDAGFVDSDDDGVLERNGKIFEMNLMTTDGLFTNDVQVSQIAAKSFEEIGIKVNIIKIDKGSFGVELRRKLSETKWDLLFWGFNPSNGSGSYQLDSMYTSNMDDEEIPRATNAVRYTNMQVDSLLQKAKISVDPHVHADILAQAQTIIWHEAPYVWLHVPEIISAVRSDVEGTEVWPVIFTIIRNSSY